MAAGGRRMLLHVFPARLYSLTRDGSACVAYEANRLHSCLITSFAFFRLILAPDAHPGYHAAAANVCTLAGNVLVFPHGDTMGSLVHEGAAVTRGAKYVIRTDVLYMLPKQQQAGGKGAGARP